MHGRGRLDHRRVLPLPITLTLNLTLDRFFRSILTLTLTLTLDRRRVLPLSLNRASTRPSQLSFDSNARLHARACTGTRGSHTFAQTCPRHARTGTRLTIDGGSVHKVSNFTRAKNEIARVSSEQKKKFKGGVAKL